MTASILTPLRTTPKREAVILTLLASAVRDFGNPACLLAMRCQALADTRTVAVGYSEAWSMSYLSK